MKNQRVNTVVHGGLVALSNSADHFSIAIKGERIVAVGPHEMMPPADRYIDATGKHVLPGAIDCHVHLRDPDNWEVGSRAAAHAGLTTLIPFGTYQGARAGTIVDVIRQEVAVASAGSVVDFGLHYILENDPTTINGLPDAIRMGVTSFKMFMTYKKRLSRMCSDTHIATAMQIVGDHGGIVQLHCENGDVIEYLENKAIAEGRTHPRYYPATCPTWAEEEAINRAILLGAMTDCPIYVVHLSTQGGLERIKRAQNDGQRVWTETCPQYLLLNEDEMENIGPRAKIGPPLRPADMVNQEAMWKGTEQGYISNIGSDHAPASPEEKEPGWQNVFVNPNGGSIPFGAPSIETIVPLVYSEGIVKRNLPLWWMARVMAENPARIFGLYPKKGVIQSGSDADLLIVDPEAEVTVHAADHQGGTGYTPYEGWKLKGRPWMTILRGHILLNDGQLRQKPGYGQFLPAGGPMPPIAGLVT